jgi:hypothetical protein
MILKFNKIESNLEKSLEKLLSVSNLIAIKAEFEAEGTRIDELIILSELCCSKNIAFTLKVGGPSAQRDFYEAFQLGADNILVPMVESKSSLVSCYEIYSKFLKLFRELKTIPNFSINIESKLSIENFEDIVDNLKNKGIPLASIVIGRTDLSSSLNNKNVDCQQILEISKHILKHRDLFNVTVGGNITANSFNFIEELTLLGLYAFESRKCTFKTNKLLTRSEFNEILNLALHFELSWLKYKKEFYSNRSIFDDSRMQIIQKRLSSV